MREGVVFGGRYRVRGTLGAGGMAVVYEAEDEILGRRVALKTLHDRYAEDESFRSRFRHEARAMASLDHENIVKVYDISQGGEAPFIVAERVGGGDIGVLLREASDGRLKESFVREISHQLLRALAYAHRRGVIHRDIKPSNILVTREGTVKVADFGIARIVEDGEGTSHGTKTRVGEPGEIVGSARYMSPEQLRGEETTPRSDLYSVGVLLYHCLTGQPPFLGDARSVARQQLHSEPTPPRRLNRGISRGMEAVILKALQKNPTDRYPSASAMLEDLVRETDSGTVPISASAARSADRSADRSAERKPARAGGRVPKKAGGRRGKALIGAAALALLLGGGGIAAASMGLLGDGMLPGDSNREESAATPVVDSPVEQASVEAPSGEEASSIGGQDESAGQSAGEESQAVAEESASQQQVEPVPVATPAEEEVFVEEGISEEVPEETVASEEGGLVPVPDLSVRFDYAAQEMLLNRGFEYQIVYQYREGYANRGVTWATDPAAGTLVPYGSTITVFATPKDEFQPQVRT